MSIAWGPVAGELVKMLAVLAVLALLVYGTTK